MTPKKDPAAAALGRRGGQAGTPAQQRARAAAARSGRPAPTGPHRWAVTIPVTDDLRERVTAAQSESGETVGEWIARACRERLDR